MSLSACVLFVTLNNELSNHFCKLSDQKQNYVEIILLTTLRVLLTRASGFSGLEWWNGLEWNGGMDWNGMVEWNGTLVISIGGHLFIKTTF